MLPLNTIAYIKIFIEAHDVRAYSGPSEAGKSFNISYPLLMIFISYIFHTLLMWFRHTDTKKERRMVGPSDLGSYRAVDPPEITSGSGHDPQKLMLI